MNDLHFTADAVAIRAAKIKTPTLEGLAYSGGMMTVRPHGPLVVDVVGLEVGRIQILAEHDDSLAGLIGSGEAKASSGKVYVTGQLSEATEIGKQVVAQARSGVQFELSIDAEILESTRVRAGETISVNGRSITAERPFLLVTKSKLRGVSLVALGADSEASATIKAKRGTEMSDTTNNADSSSTPATDHLQTIREQEATETERIAGIRAACNGEHSTIEATAIRGGWQVDRCELAVLRASRPTCPSAHIGHGNRVDSPAVLEAALFGHLGHEGLGEKELGEQTMQRGRDMHARHFCDILEAGLRLSGHEGAMSRDKMIRAALSDASISNVLSNVQGKILVDQYNRFPSVARIIAKQLTARDFKTQTGVRLVGRSTLLDEIGSGGEIQHGSLEDTAYTFSVDTYAKMYGLDRRHIINDDLSALDEMPKIIARGAALKVESIFWALVLNNTSNFFASASGNYLTTALGSAGLTAAVTLIRQMTDADGEPVLVVPKYLVVPPELEVTGDELHASANIVVAGSTDAERPNANAYSGKYKPLVVPYLSNDNYTNYSATGWYLFGDPGDVAAFGLAYLNGQQAPTVEQSDANFNTLGIEWRGYLDFGVCQIDSKGGVMSTGGG